VEASDWSAQGWKFVQRNYPRLMTVAERVVAGSAKKVVEFRPVTEVEAAAIEEPEEQPLDALQEAARARLRDRGRQLRGGGRGAALGAAGIGSAGRHARKHRRHPLAEFLTMLVFLDQQSDDTAHEISKLFAKVCSIRVSHRRRKRVSRGRRPPQPRRRNGA